MLGQHKKISIIIHPSKGIKFINCHHPDLFVSCNLLVVTEIQGRRVAIHITVLTEINVAFEEGKIISIIASTIIKKSIKNQNSERLARPEKLK